MRLSSTLTIMDKPKHEQVALRRALELQQSSGARIEAVSFCWQSMAEASEAFTRDQRRTIKQELLRNRKVWQHVDPFAGRAHHVDPFVGRSVASKGDL